MTAAVVSPFVPDLPHRAPSRGGPAFAEATPIRHLERVPTSELQGTLPLRFGEAEPTVPTLDPHRAELTAFAQRFSAVIVEVIGGDRGVQQVLRWTSERVYADLLRRTDALQHTAGNDQRIGRLRARIRSVRVSFPLPGIAEISVHVSHGHRSRALALRVERVGPRWQCTALEFG